MWHLLGVLLVERCTAAVAPGLRDEGSTAVGRRGGAAAARRGDGLQLGTW